MKHRCMSDGVVTVNKPTTRMVWLMVATISMLIRFVHSNYPVFDAASNMRHLLLPADTRIGSIVYRLRGSDSDKDYPLLFKATDYGSYVIRIESLPCNITSAHCAANVYLERSVSPGQLFKFRMTVRDTQGDTTTVAVTIEVTDATSDINTVFPHIPGVIMVPEDTKVNTELEYVIVRKNPRNTKPAKLELWRETNGSFLEPSRQFQLTQTTTKERTTGTIRLGLPLDYEQKTMYKLSVFATDMYVVPGKDSRNIAGFQLVIVIVDVQDTPPIWDHIPPITRLPINLTEGDIVLKVTAKDGDKGTPRKIKYGLVSEGNPFTVFFTIGIETGEIRLVRPLRELTAISRSHQPILLTVVAEEIVTPGENPPPMSSEATVALLLDEVGNTPPYFQSPNYVSRVEENSLQGTALVFDDLYIVEVRDDDMGKHGVFTLSLENNNGTFEISPTVAERRAYFVIRVRDNSMLDYEERQVVSFMIEAKEVATDSKPLSSNVSVVIYITDVNDNPPVFSQEEYTAKMPENVTTGVHIVTISATDVDTDLAGTVRYTAIYGYLNTSLTLHPKSGDISVATDKHSFDREQASEYHYYVEARDEDGMGNRATVPFVIQVLDVNDEKPVFLQNPMDFILAPDGHNFSDRVFVKAVDNDAEPPNNIVQYEIVSGNYGNRFLLNSTSGELTVQPSDNARSTRQTQTQNSESSVTVLMVRAYDLGIPTQSSVGQVRVYPPESGARVMTFIIPGKNPDKKSIEEMLTVLTGGRVTIQEIHPYYGFNGPAQDLTHNLPDTDKSVVIATVLYNKNSVVDLEHLQQRFTTNNSETTLTVKEYTNENKVLFWVLVLILILIALAILTLLLCCLCPCCPLYAIGRKRSRIHTAENVQFVVHTEEPGHENKGVQAEWIGSGRKEAWSADSYNQHRWHFNRRNVRRNETQRVILVAASAATHTRADSDIMRPQPPPPTQHHQHHLRPPPVSVIYTNDVAQHLHQTDRIIMEDIDGTEYRVLDPSRLTLPIRRDEEPDSDSMRRHEFERGSDVVADQTVNQDENFTENAPRDQMFIRDGNAEILRLITRGRAVEEDKEPGLNQPERPYTAEEKNEIKRHEEDGKEIIMKRFMEDQRTSADRQKSLREKEESVNINKEVEQPKEESEDLMQKIMDIPEANLSTTDVNRLTTLQRDLLLTRFLVEEQRRTLAAQVVGHDETQSLPGMTTSMATQTDVNRGTQTELLYTMRPPRRKAKSDIDDSGESETEDNGEVRLRKLKKTRRKIDSEFDLPDRVRSMSRCEIKTPILEENESTMEAAGETSSRTKGSNHKLVLAKHSLEDQRAKHREAKGIKRADSTGKIRSVESEVKDGKDTSLGGFANTKTSLLRLQTTRKKLKKDDNNMDEQTVPLSKQYALTESSEDELLNSRRKSVSEQNLQHSNSSFSAGKTVNSSFKSLQPTPILKRKNIHDRDFELSTDLEETERSKSSKHSHPSKFDSNRETPLSRKSKGNSFSEERINEESKLYIRQKSASQPDIEKDEFIRKPAKSANSKELVRKEKQSKTEIKPRYMEYYKRKREEQERQREEEKLKSTPPTTNAKSGQQTKRQTPTPRDNKREGNKDLVKRNLKTPTESRISKTSRSTMQQKDKDTDDSWKLQTHRSGRQDKSLQQKQKRTEGLIQTERKMENDTLRSTPRNAKGPQGILLSNLQKNEMSEDSLQSSPRKPTSYGAKIDSPSRTSDFMFPSTSKRTDADRDILKSTPRRLENQTDSLPLVSKRIELQPESLKTTYSHFNGHEEDVSQLSTKRMESREDILQQRFEDDKDSGIAMSQMLTSSQKLKRKNQNLMEKKSVFTIAYDDMQTKQLRLDSASPP